tara:strand:+ start:1644 stop:2402 length:759 start_codon:yes stop_codon:yes gene_type:complete
MFKGEFFHTTSAAAGFYSHQIEQSARFDRASGSYMQRTIGTPSNVDKGTFSLWFKKTLNGAYVQLFHTIESSQGINVIFYDTDKLYSDVAAGSDAGNSDAVFRDTTAWGHLVFRVDTTESSNNDRVRVYLNGSQLDGFTGSISQNTDYKLNKSGNVLYLGHNTGATYNYDGYLAEVIFTDGQSYAPSQFGETKNGVWIPKDPSGTTFGDNGFHLKFEDASDLGNDSSGNNNDFSVTNMGTDHQVSDSPTFGS